MRAKKVSNLVNLENALLVYGSSSKRRLLKLFAPYEPPKIYGRPLVTAVSISLNFHF